MDKNTKFLMISTVALAVITLSFVIYISSQDTIIRQKQDPVEVEKEETEIEDLKTTEPITPITQHKSAEEEINDILEQDLITDTGVSYRVTLLGYWNEFKNADWHTSGSHFSPFVAWSYYSTIDDPVYQISSKASEGMREMAETGAPEKLIDEIREKALEGTILDFNTGSLLFTPSQTSIVLNLDKNHSIASVVSMIAPSPDWFIGTKINLYQNKSWVKDTTVDAINYDAGTDSGKKFKSFNKRTNPRENIRELQDASTIPIASFRFQRIK